MTLLGSRLYALELLYFGAAADKACQPGSGLCCPRPNKFVHIHVSRRQRSAWSNARAQLSPQAGLRFALQIRLCKPLHLDRTVRKPPSALRTSDPGRAIGPRRAATWIVCPMASAGSMTVVHAPVRRWHFLGNLPSGPSLILRREPQIRPPGRIAPLTLAIVAP